MIEYCKKNKDILAFSYYIGLIDCYKGITLVCQEHNEDYFICNVKLADAYIANQCNH
jgi:hypothetical protein